MEPTQQYGPAACYKCQKPTANRYTYFYSPPNGGGDGSFVRVVVPACTMCLTRTKQLVIAIVGAYFGLMVVLVAVSMPGATPDGESISYGPLIAPAVLAAGFLVWVGRMFARARSDLPVSAETAAKKLIKKASRVTPGDYRTPSEYALWEQAGRAEAAQRAAASAQERARRRAEIEARRSERRRVGGEQARRDAEIEARRSEQRRVEEEQRRVEEERGKKVAEEILRGKHPIESGVKELIRLYGASGGRGFLVDTSRAKPVEEVGAALDKRGGFDMMLAAHRQFARRYPVLGMARNLEMVWDGIGGWRG
ncbi:MAG: hypothetical protein LBG60_07395 [Bifidobacteriaceae bacterium]|jgi:hypothetical protein|nr:hypothetical protein [Bifidobacteriaceae bacterium]